MGFVGLGVLVKRDPHARALRTGIARSDLFAGMRSRSLIFSVLLRVNLWVSYIA